MKKAIIGIKALESIGSKLLSSEMNEFAEFRIYDVPDSGISIQIRRSLAKPNLDFLPAIVKDSEGKILWGFAAENFKGLGRLLVVDGELVIALTDWTHVRKVIPVNDLPKVKIVKVGEGTKIVGGRGIQAIINLKHAVAEAFRLKADITDGERDFLAKIRQAKDYREAEKSAEREEARRKRIAEIMARDQISGFPENGKCRFGVPVLEDEWRMLPVTTGGVVLVSGFSENGEPLGDTATAFFIGRSKGQPVQEAKVEIKLRGRGRFDHKPKQTQTTPTVALNSFEEILFEISEKKEDLVPGFYEAILTDTLGFSSLKKSGLNSGALIALPSPNGDEGMVQVEKMTGGGSTTLGIFKRL